MTHQSNRGRRIAGPFSFIAALATLALAAWIVHIEGVTACMGDIR